MSKTTTVVIETRVDVRDLATIILYQDRKNLGVPRTKSDLVRISVEGFANSLRQSGMSPKVRWTLNALQMLEKFGISFKNTKDTYNREILRQIQREALERDEVFPPPNEN